jgi:hypothetical protein
MKQAENGKIIRLIATIEKDLSDLETLKNEVDEIDIHNTHPRILGSILHDFYTGVEKIFLRIASDLEGGQPQGKSWHKDLLDEMAIGLNRIRPAVIDEELRMKLEEYLRFRHLFRGIYGFQLSQNHLEIIFENFDDIYKDFNHAIKNFIEFLRSIE